MWPGVSEAATSGTATSGTRYQYFQTESLYPLIQIPSRHNRRDPMHITHLTPNSAYNEMFDLHQGAIASSTKTHASTHIIIGDAFSKSEYERLRVSDGKS